MFVQEGLEFKTFILQIFSRLFVLLISCFKDGGEIDKSAEGPPYYLNHDFFLCFSRATIKFIFFRRIMLLS